MRTLLLALVLTTTYMDASIDYVLLHLKHRVKELHIEYHTAGLEDKARICGRMQGLFEAIDVIEKDIECD